MFVTNENIINRKGSFIVQEFIHHRFLYKIYIIQKKRFTVKYQKVGNNYESVECDQQIDLILSQILDTVCISFNLTLLGLDIIYDLTHFYIVDVNYFPSIFFNNLQVIIRSPNFKSTFIS